MIVDRRAVPNPKKPHIVLRATPHSRKKIADIYAAVNGMVCRVAWTDPLSENERWKVLREACIVGMTDDARGAASWGGAQVALTGEVMRPRKRYLRRIQP